MIIHWYEEIPWDDLCQIDKNWFTIAFDKIGENDLEMKKWLLDTYEHGTVKLGNLGWGEIQVKTEEQVMMFLLKWG